MTLRELVDNSFENDYVIEEGISITPLVLFFAFNPKNVKKIVGNAQVTAEKTKAKLGLKSGRGDTATIYKLNSEQKEFLNKLDKKYGNEISNIIKKFRVEFAAPYQIMKRNVEKYGKSTSISRLGMSKDEYLRAYESGKNKILRMNTKDESFINNKFELEKRRKAVNLLREKYVSFSNGKNLELTPEILEKALSYKNLSEADFNFPIATLESAYKRLKRYQEHLDTGNFDETNENGEQVTKLQIAGVNNHWSKKQLLDHIEDIRKYGYRNGGETKTQQRTKNKEEETNSSKAEAWRSAFNRYMLRKETIKDFEKNFSRSDFVTAYKNVLKSELDNAEKRYEEAKTTFYNTIPRHELNETEKKIWKLKPTGKINSGKLEDWKLMIKPEDFGTVEIEKPLDVKMAEKEIKTITNDFERKLSKVLTSDEMEMLKELRLIDNFITLKIKNENGSKFIKDTASRKVKSEKEDNGEENDTDRKSDE